MSPECKHPGCERESYRIGYCNVHRNRFRLGKDMDAPVRGTVPLEELFWAKVSKSDGCWEWQACKNLDGYGSFWNKETMVGAHRFSYELSFGPIPAGLQVDHTCINPGCVNPSHMRLATNALNSQNKGGAHSNSSSGLRGVSWHKRDRLWQAYATLNGKRAYIGRFATIEEADTAASEWRREHMPYSLMDQKKAE